MKRAIGKNTLKERQLLNAGDIGCWFNAFSWCKCFICVAKLAKKIGLIRENMVNKVLKEIFMKNFGKILNI